LPFLPYSPSTFYRPVSGKNHGYGGSGSRSRAESEKEGYTEPLLQQVPGGISSISVLLKPFGWVDGPLLVESSIVLASGGILQIK